MGEPLLRRLPPSMKKIFNDDAGQQFRKPLPLIDGNDFSSMSNIRIFNARSSRLDFSLTQLELQKIVVRLSQPPSQQPSIAKPLLSRIIQRPPRIRGLEFPSMQLQHQMRQAKQYLAGNVQGNIDDVLIPQAILALLSYRIYDLQTIEPFGKIHLERLNRPATQGRLGFVESKVDAYLTRRYTDITSYQPRAVGSRDADEGYEGLEEEYEELDETPQYESIDGSSRDADDLYDALVTCPVIERKVLIIYTIGVMTLLYAIEFYYVLPSVHVYRGSIIYASAKGGLWETLTEMAIDCESRYLRAIPLDILYLY
ncbi:hypothetical protein F4801DRAFT_227542 [Xylaria longipes]|nr:hypothetical protein F4801DRAFT_227542 [Xylaria longipes]